MSFSFLSVCSGLEAATLAFHALGATAVGFSEIEAFPSAIIAHRLGANLPGEPLSHNAPPNFGDFTQLIDPDSPARAAIDGKIIDVLIGGTPCQAFSIAGKRLSLADARGNLTLAFAVLAHELARSHGLRNAVWENVPGSLSTKDNAFGCFLGAIVGADDALHTPDGGSWPNLGMVAGPRARAAWRVLDAQYFGVAQRRRRVFLVADFGNGADPAAVLFEPKGLHGNPAPRREKGEGIAPTIAARTRGGGGLGTDFDCDGGLICADVAPTLNAHFGEKQGLEDQHINGGCGMFVARPIFATSGQSNAAFSDDQALALNSTNEALYVAHALRGEGFDASEDGTGRGTPIVPVCFDARQSDVCVYGEKAAPLDTDGYSQAVAFSCKDHGADKSHANAGGQAAVAFQTRGSNLDIGDISGTIGSNADRASGGAPMIAQAFDLRGREGGAQFEGPHDTANIRAASGGSSRSYVAFAQNSRDEVRIQGDGDICGALSAEPGMKQTTYVASVAPTMRAGGKETGGARPYGTDADTCDSLVGETWAVRRLTPRECERLQGVPDDYSAIPWRGKPAEECPDGPRYRALGNSWAVPVVRWIGERLARELDVVKDREKPRP